MTQQELGARTGKREKDIGRWERGEQLPRVGALVDLSVALGVSTDYLLGVNGETENAPRASGQPVLPDRDETLDALAGAMARPRRSSPPRPRSSRKGGRGGAGSGA